MYAPSKNLTYIYFFIFSSECEQEIQWLKEAGFHGIVKKFKGKDSCMVELVGSLFCSLLYIYSVPYRVAGVDLLFMKDIN